MALRTNKTDKVDTRDPRVTPQTGDCVLVPRDGSRPQRRYVRWVQNGVVSWGTRRVVSGGNAYRTLLNDWRTETANATVVEE